MKYLSSLPCVLPVYVCNDAVHDLSVLCTYEIMCVCKTSLATSTRLLCSFLCIVTIHVSIVYSLYAMCVIALMYCVLCRALSESNRHFAAALNYFIILATLTCFLDIALSSLEKWRYVREFVCVCVCVCVCVAGDTLCCTMLCIACAIGS